MDKPVKILCIDDEADIRFALKAVFDQQGWEALMAQDMKQGLEFFVLHRPDLVLIDYHMPNINGLDGVKLLRHLSDTTPIIVFTIEENQAIANQFLEAGATDFAMKPIKAPDLVSRISLHMRLLIQEKKHKAPSAMAKGMGSGTLGLITKYLAKQQKPCTTNEIAKGTGLAHPTVYRYLQHMLNENIVVVQVDYGRVGRPKQSYCLRQGTDLGALDEDLEP